jgi:threonyl-tRNA synthetase
MLQKIIKIAYMLDVNGYAKEADLMDKLLIRLSQTPGPFNADIPLNSRVVPFADLDEEFKDVQKERENFPRFDQDYYDITPQDDKAWDEAEAVLRSVLENQDVKFYEAENEAAFYGPKIDIQMKDKRGQENTAFTVQYDFVMPKRFKLNYVDQENKEKEAIVIHRSSIGAIERIMAFLIEHYEGAFPTWLSPIQVQVLPVSEKHNTYARSIFEKLREEGVRVEIDDSNETLGKKVRDAKMQKVPYLLVVGDKEVDSNEVTVESRTEKIGAMSLENFLSKIQTEIKERKQ